MSNNVRRNEDNKVNVSIPLSTIVITILQVVFIVLKLKGIMTWDWFWVFSPIIISCLMTIFGILIFVFVFIIAFLIRKK